MKLAHYFSARIPFKKEDKEELSAALRGMLMLAKPKDKIAVKEEHDPQPYLVAELRRESDINRFFRALAAALPAQDKKAILERTDGMVDDHLDFFIRIDEKNWGESQTVALATSPPCFYLVFNMAAFPKRKENAVALVREIFKT